MTDPMRDVVRSPLDDLPAGAPPWVRLAAASGAAALLAGLATAGVVLARSDPSPTEPVTIASIPAEPTPAPHGLPPGYVDVGAGYGIRVEWIMQGDDELLIGMSSAVASDAERSDVRPIGSTILGSTRRAVGAWTLRLSDGRVVAHRAEHLDDGATGMLTVSFPVSGLRAADVVALEMAPAIGAGMRVTSDRIPVDGVPFETSNGVSVEATELVEAGSGGPVRSGESSLVVQRLQAGWSAGWIEWRLEGIEGVRARLEAEIVLAGEGIAPENRAVLVTDIAAGTRFLQREPAPLTPAAAGSVHLVRAGRPGLSTYDVTGLEVTWTVTWARYADHTLVVPVGGVAWIVG